VANTKISELTALGATPADDDVLAIVDTSDSTTKKVTVSNLVSAASGFDPNTDNPAIGNGSSTGTNSQWPMVTTLLPVLQRAIAIGFTANVQYPQSMASGFNNTALGI
jgi:hypothetical protein